MHYTIYSLNCVVRHFVFENIVQLFIKFTHSFVAIELLNFCNNAKKTILLLKRALGIPYVNRIDFFAFCVYKCFAKILLFYMNENYDDCHHRKTRRTFIYRKSKKKLPNVFIYKKPDTFLKARQFPLRFLYTKNDIL